MLKGKGWLKIIIWVVVILVVLILAGTLILKLVFTKDKIISMLSPLIESGINRKVEIKDAGLSVWGGLGLDLKGVTIYSLPEFSYKELARIEAVSLRVKPFPLLRGRIELTKGILVKPKIVVERKEIVFQKNKEHIYRIQIYNWDNLVKGGPALALPIIFGQMEVKDGNLLYFSPSEKIEINVSGINQKIKFFIGKDRYDKGGAEGEISINHIQLNLPNYKGKFPALPLSLKHDLKIDLEQDRLEVDKFDLSLGDIELALKGNVEKIRTIPQANLELSSKEVPLEKVASYLSPLKKELAQLQITGQMDLSLNLKGELRRIPPPQVEGKASFKRVKVGFAQNLPPLEIPYAEVLFSPKNVSLSTSDASWAGIPLDFKGVVDDFISPSFNFQLKSDFDTKLLQKFENFPKDIKTQGGVKINLRAYGKLANPQGAMVSGSANFNKINLGSPNLTVPIKDLNASLILKDYDLTIQELRCNLGQSDLDFKGKISDIVPHFLFPEKNKNILKLDFVLNSAFLNLDELLPPADTSKTMKKETPKKPPILLPNVDVQGKLSAQKAIFRKIQFTDFMADVSFFDKVLRIENISSKVYQGTVDGTAEYDLTKPENPKFDLVFNAKKIEMNDFATGFLNTPLLFILGDRVYGKLDLISHFKGQGNDVEEINKSLWGEGKGTLTDGRIEYGEMLNSLGKSLGFDIPKEDQIKSLTNSFRIENQRLYFDDYQLRGTKADWDITGSVGFDESLDYRVTLSLPMEVARQYVKSGDLLSLLQDKKGRVVLPIKVSGTVKSPKYSLDTSQSEKKLKDEVKTKGEELLKSLFGK